MNELINRQTDHNLGIFLVVLINAKSHKEAKNVENVI